MIMNELTLDLKNKDEEIDSIRKKILLVDDELVTRLYAREALEAANFDVIETESGEEAINILTQNNVDAVLLDINMPGMNGYEACRQIRLCTSDPFLPVIVVTGMEDLDSIEYAYQVGATDFSTKPVKWSIMKKRLHYLIRTRFLSHELKISEQGRRELIEAIPDTILRINAQGGILEIKPGDKDSGAIVSALSDINLNGQLPGEMFKGFQANISMVLKGEGSCQFEFEMCQGGSSLHYEMRMFASGDNEVVAMVRDITERHRDEEHIRHIAFHDIRTGLPNLSFVHQKLKTILKRCADNNSKVVVMRFEIVGLDHINSLLGTESGDDLLRLWASRLSKVANALCNVACETKETLVGRVNGPGFVLVLEGMKDDFELKDYSDLLEKKMAETFLIGEYEMNVISRTGAAISKVGDMDTYGLMKKSGLALAEARKSDKNGLNLYSEQTHARTIGHVSMTHDLHRAIENGELHLEYQPKVVAETGKLMGVEALTRWNDSERGIVTPDIFIPLAEESNLILALSEFVIFEACYQSRQWRRAGYEMVPIAINLSGHQFNQRDIVENIRNTMSIYSLQSNALEIELTESVAINNSAQVKKILCEFREHGIKTAIDDFGTGYSSLSSLRNFPFNTLKIDRSFVKDVSIDQNSASITEAIINMGHVLGLQIVAEGVENVEQLNFLREKKCDVIQGYFTGRPVAASYLEDNFLSSCVQ